MQEDNLEIHSENCVCNTCIGLKMIRRANRFGELISTNEWIEKNSHRFADGVYVKLKRRIVNKMNDHS